MYSMHSMYSMYSNVLYVQYACRLVCVWQLWFCLVGPFGWYLQPCLVVSVCPVVVALVGGCYVCLVVVQLLLLGSCVWLVVLFACQCLSSCFCLVVVFVSLFVP